MKIKERFVKRVLKNLEISSGQDAALYDRTVEAAVRMALRKESRKYSVCISPLLHCIVSQFDAANWGSNSERLRSLRRLAVAQLGTSGMDEVLFAQKFAAVAIGELLPIALRRASDLQLEPYRSGFINAARRCQRERTIAAATEAVDLAFNAQRVAAARHWKNPAAHSAAYRCAFAAAAFEAFAEDIDDECWAAAAVEIASDGMGDLRREIAEDIVQILIEMKTPGSSFLYLTHEEG